MSYDLVVLDKQKRFTNKKDFLEWYNVLTEWADNVDYNDYAHTTPSLQKWFLEMKDIVPPLNGKSAPPDDELDKGEFLASDYTISKDAIYVAFAWSNAEKVHPIVAMLAKKHDVAFFDITNERVIYPDGFILDVSRNSSDAHLSLFHKLKNFLSTL